MLPRDPCDQVSKPFLRFFDPRWVLTEEMTFMFFRRAPAVVRERAPTGIFV